MEINENTLEVLQNFATINQNILIRPGQDIRTISEARNILGKATLDIEFPMEFGVYNLNEFLGALSIVDKPNLDFKEQHVQIGDSSGRSKIKYFFSSPDTLTFSEKDITMPECEVKFTLDQSTIKKLKNAASTLGHKELIITGNNNLLTLTVTDSGNSTANSYSIDIDGEYESEMFKFILDIENLKILPGDYEVNISSKLISHFVNKEKSVQYWVALEKTSNYGG